MNNLPQNSAIYRLANLKKIYQDRTVLDIPELTVYQGEFLALIGPSGSGKSTLLRLLNFLEYPSSGQITFMGSTYENGKDIPVELRRRVTTVFQHPLLLNRNVRDNIAYGLHIHGLPAHQAITQPILETIGLVKLANQRARTLSGGEAQRVALGRAIALQPDVLLLDEPTANLDPPNVAMIESIITQLNLLKKTTIILITHHIFQARRLAQRTGFILDGKIIELDDTSVIFNASHDPRTRSFLHGEMIY